MVAATSRGNQCILVVLVDEDDMCEQFEVWRRSIHVEVLPTQRGTFDGLTLELATGFDRVHIENAVVGGLSGRGWRGNWREHQRHSQSPKIRGQRH